MLAAPIRSRQIVIGLAVAMLLYSQDRLAPIVFGCVVAIAGKDKGNQETLPGTQNIAASVHWS